jgi:multimeric flavodoxin WrbA
LIIMTRIILIITHSRKGFTDNMAKSIAQGVNKVQNVKAVIKRVNEVQLSDFAEANALAIGSPIFLDYISGELKHLLDNVFYKFHKKEKINRLKGKPAAAFVCGRYKGYHRKKLQFSSIVLNELQHILFSNLEMKKVINGIHLVHPIESLDPRAPLPLTHKQVKMCESLGRKLALDACAQPKTTK